MAPEQVSRPQDVDHRADIYSLGVVFYQMLTGELPAAKLEPPSRKVQIDVRLDEVVLRALEKEPERRYQQVSEVRTQVETIVATPANAAHAQRADSQGFLGARRRCPRAFCFIQPATPDNTSGFSGDIGIPWLLRIHWSVE